MALDAAVSGTAVEVEKTQATWSLVSELNFIRSLGRNSEAMAARGFTRAQLLKGYKASIAGRFDGKFSAADLRTLHDCVDCELVAVRGSR